MDPLFTPQSTLVFPLQLGFWLISKQNGIKNFQGTLKADFGVNIRQILTLKVSNESL